MSEDFVAGAFVQGRCRKGVFALQAGSVFWPYRFAVTLVATGEAILDVRSNSTAVLFSRLELGPQQKIYVLPG